MAKKRKVSELTIDINANVARLAQDMGKAVNILSGFESKVAKIGTALKVIGGAAVGIAAFTSINALGRALEDLASKGELVGSISDAFKTLGGSNGALEDARKAVLGTVSAFDLMAIANKGLLRNIPEFNSQFAQMAELAQRFADATGRDTKEVLDQLVEALAKGKTKGLEPFGFALEGIKGKSEITKEALRQIPQVIDQLAPSLDSVKNAQDGYNTALDDAIARMGITINQNPTLIRGFRQLEEAINAVDWETFGQNLSTVAGIFASMASNGLPRVVEYINTLAIGFDAAFGDTTVGKLTRLQTELDALLKRKAEFENPTAGGGSLFQLLTGNLNKRQQGEQSKINPQIDSIRSQMEAIKNEELRQNAKAQHEIVMQRLTSQNASLKLEESALVASLDRQAAAEAKHYESAAKMAADAGARAIEAFNKTVAGHEKSKLQESIESAIQSLDKVSFDSAAQKLKDVYKQGIIDAHKEALAAGVSRDAVEQYAEDSAQHQVDKFTEKFQKASKENADKLKEDMTEAYQQSVDAWTDMFMSAMDGSLASFEQIFKRILAELAGSLMTNLFGASGGLVQALTTGQGLGSALANSLIGLFTGKDLGSTLGDLFTGAAGAAGWTELFSGGAAAAAVPVGTAAAGGLLMSDGTIAMSSAAGAGAAGASAGAGGMLGAAGPYAAAGIAIAAVAHSMWPKIEKLLGGGISDKETLARRHGGEKIEELVKQLSTVAFYNKDKQLQVLDAKSYDFVTGRGEPFNQKGWADEMNSWGEDARRTFEGLGQALEEIWGLGEDVGAQLGFLLGKNFAANVDNARLLVQQLGLSYQELEDAMIQAGRSGEMTWHEVETGLQGLADAFEPGLQAFADVKGAMDELMDSGGRGVAALKAVKDIAVEAMEAGAKTIDDLKQKLLEKGVDPAIVDAFMQALAQRGIQTLQQLAQASDRVAGGIVADLESNSKVVADKWKEIGDNIKNVKDELEGIPSDIAINFNVTANMDDAAKKLLESDAMSSQDVQTLKNLPEATGSGTTGATSSSRGAYRGKSIADTSVHTRGLQVHIDARGAARGVDTDIRQALATVEERAVRRSLRAVQDAQSRGRL